MVGIYSKGSRRKRNHSNLQILTVSCASIIYCVVVVLYTNRNIASPHLRKPLKSSSSTSASLPMSSTLNPPSYPEKKNVTSPSSANNETNENKEKDDKPLLILHVGPPKTGTKSIQDALNSQKNRLWGDSYFYYHKVERMYPMKGDQDQNLIDSQFQWELFEFQLKYLEPIGYWQEQVAPLLEYMRKFAKKNVVLSAEEFCFENHFPDNFFSWGLLRSSLDDKWNVKVIVTYRRYFEWITSWYYRMHAQKWTFLENAHHAFYSGTKLNQTFLRFYNETMMEARRLEKEGKQMDAHPTIFAQSKFSKHFSNVAIFNGYNSSNKTSDKRKRTLEESFVCDMIPNAKATCKYFKNAEDEILNNPTVDSNFAKILHILHVKEMITKTQLRAVLAKYSAFQAEFASKLMKKKNKFPGLPYNCLSKVELDKLLEISLSFEKYLLPEWTSNYKVQQEHINDFQSAVQKKKFCDVDFDALFLGVKNLLTIKKGEQKFSSILALAIRLSEKAELLDKKKKRRNKNKLTCSIIKNYFFSAMQNYFF